MEHAIFKEFAVALVHQGAAGWPMRAAAPPQLLGGGEATSPGSGFRAIGERTNVNAGHEARNLGRSGQA
jgi:hypothetical protein